MSEVIQLAAERRKRSEKVPGSGELWLGMLHTIMLISIVGDGFLLLFYVGLVTGFFQTVWDLVTDDLVAIAVFVALTAMLARFFHVIGDRRRRKAKKQHDRRTQLERMWSRPPDDDPPSAA